MMRVRDVMTTDVISVTADQPYKDLVSLLLDNDISGVPVVDDEGTLVGVVSEADLISHEAYGGRRRRPLALVGSFLTGDDPRWLRKTAGTTAGDLMTAAIYVARPEESLQAAAKRMLVTGVNRLPVVEDGRLLGIVTRHDLLRLFDRSDEEIEAEIDELLASPLTAPEDHHVRVSVNDGIVHLEGKVHYEHDRPVVEHLAAHVDGVVAVSNDVTAEARDPSATGVR